MEQLNFSSAGTSNRYRLFSTFHARNIGKTNLCEHPVTSLAGSLINRLPKQRKSDRLWCYFELLSDLFWILFDLPICLQPSHDLEVRSILQRYLANSNAPSFVRSGQYEIMALHLASK
jgi:hypothetical protein